MTKNTFIILLLFITSFVSCAVSKYADTSNHWIDVVVTEDVTYYVDTTSIHREGNLIVTREKRLYEPSSRQQYISHITTKLRNLQKAKAWSDFSYNIYTSEYDCANKRSRVIVVEDYDSQGRLIQRTKSDRKTLKWVDVEQESIRDYTFFFVCDYNN